MTAKEYLSQIRRLTIRISRLKLEKQQFLDLASTPSAVSFEPRFSASRPTSASFEKLVDKASEIDETICAEQNRLDRLIAAATERILDMEDFDERYILLQRYIKFASWEHIAADLHYSISWVYKLHGRALQGFQKKIVEDSQG